MTLEQIKKRFGDIAVEKGFITEDQRAEALEVQQENDLNGLDRRLIGSVLYRRGYMTIEQVVEVLTELDGNPN